MQRCYHIALRKGIGQGPHANGHRTGTLIIDMVDSMDQLSPQTWQYLGAHETTKARMRKGRAALLAAVNAQHPTPDGRPLFTRAMVE